MFEEVVWTLLDRLVIITSLIMFIVWCHAIFWREK